MENARLHWQCRRGMLELDLLLSDFLSNGYELLEHQQQKIFIDLLETPDPELFEYLMRRSVHKEAHVQDVINTIISTTRN